MFRYYLQLGVRSLRRNPALTALMVLTLAVGVAASVATLTILHVMSADPVPAKSAKLLSPLLDVGPLKTYVPGERNPFQVQMTYPDTLRFLQSGQGVRRVPVYDILASVQPERSDLPVQDLNGSATNADFFGAFELPFLWGAPWTAADDRAEGRVAVLSRKKAQLLFGEANPVGRTLRLWQQDFRIVGVLADAQPLPRYFHLLNGNGGPFNGEEDILVPFTTAIRLEVPNNGNTSCSGEAGAGFQGLLESECTWIQFWFELASAADRPALQQWLDAYMADQRRVGRLPRPVPGRLFDVMDWMQFMEVVHDDQRIAVWLAFGFLLLCVVNTTGLLLAKLSARAPEVGVRRALGATRFAIFRQFLVESAVVGLAGGVLGLVFSAAALWVIRQMSKDLSVVATLDLPMLAATFAIAVVASLLAGLLPTWRASQVTPALQLKSQ